MNRGDASGLWLTAAKYCDAANTAGSISQHVTRASGKRRLEPAVVPLPKPMTRRLRAAGRRKRGKYARLSCASMSLPVLASTFPFTWSLVIVDVWSTKTLHDGPSLKESSFSVCRTCSGAW